MTSRWHFACDSDQHYCYPIDDPNGQPHSRKNDIVQQIAEINSKYKLDLLICPGDLTDHGADGSKMCLCCKKDQLGNEYDALITEYITPIKDMGIDVKICPGNHDVWKWTYPKVSILKYIRDTYGGTYSWFNVDNSGCYKFIHKGITFICMGVYPKNLDWLKKNLPANKSDPLVIFYHYNTNPAEPWSDWWTDLEKSAFYDTIVSYNIKLLINGHCHTTKTGTWRDIPYVLCANKPIVVEVFGEDLTVLNFL